MQRRRHQEFIRILNAVEREVPAGKTGHAILDNCSAHKHPAPRSLVTVGAGVAEIKQLWVDVDHRGHGVGRRLLEAAIGEAIIRDCHSVWTLSYDFQAQGFYEKHGFERVAELRDWPPGHTHIVLRRSLKADPNP
jgi:ribosomal protein S18 acetylase RimI-like enzyme